MQDAVTVYRLIIVHLKRCKSSNIWDNPNTSKFYSGRNEKQIEFRECLPSSGAESFVFQFTIKNIKIKI